MNLTRTVLPPNVPELSDTQTTLHLTRPFVACPRLAHGIRRLDISRNVNIRVKSAVHASSNTSIECHISTWHNTTLYSGVVDVLALAPADLQFLTGEYTRNLSADPNSPASVRVNFERPFVTPPKVVVFLNSIDLDNNRNFRLRTFATDISEDGFTLTLETWADTVFNAAQACWIAYPENSEHIFSTSVTTTKFHSWDNPRARESDEIKFDTSVEFWKIPSVFVALSHIDFNHRTNLRIDAYVDNVSKTGLTWHLDSWDDTVHHGSSASIIAFN